MRAFTACDFYQLPLVLTSASQPSVPATADNRLPCAPT